jgi:two-component system sensor histidine kinase CreC
MPLAPVAQPRHGLPMAYEALEHELRTPLASLRSLAEILRDHPDLPEAERRRFLDAMIAETRRLQGTLDAILEWADERA